MTISKFGEMEVSWRQLHRALGGTPLLDPLFVRPLIEEFGSGEETLAIHGPPDTPTAMTILCKKNRFAWQTFQPVNAPLGVWMNRPEVGLERVSEELLRTLSVPALILGLSQRDPDLTPRPSRSKRLRTRDYIRTARINIEGVYEAYWSARSKNLKHNMRRQLNRLDREGKTPRLEEIRSPEAMRAAVADYARLESAGWKEEAGSAVHLENPQGNFYTKILEGFGRNGEAIVYRYFYDDRLVATDLCLTRDKVLIILKTTHDESQKGTSPAHLMRHEVIQNAFRTRAIGRIEFYGPVHDWHLRWTEDVRTLYHVNYYRSALLPHLHERISFADRL